MHEHPFRVALRAELPADVAERADEILLLGVDRDDRRVQRQLQLDGGVEVAELGVEVRGSELELSARLGRQNS